MTSPLYSSGNHKDTGLIYFATHTGKRIMMTCRSPVSAWTTTIAIVGPSLQTLKQTQGPRAGLSK